MIIDSSIISYMLHFVLTFLAIMKMMSAFLGQRKTSMFQLGATFIFCIGLYLFNNFVLVPMDFILGGFLGILCALANDLTISFNYQASFKKRLACSIITVSLIIFIETFIAILAVIISNQIIVNLGYVYVLLGVLNYLCALWFYRFKNFKKATFISKKLWFLFLSIPILSVFFVFIFLIQLSLFFAAISIIFLFIINFIILYYQDALSTNYQIKLQSTLDVQEKEYYFTQNKLMIETVEMVKSIRHDMKLHLATLRDFATDHPEMICYINSLIGELEKSEIHSDTGNVAFDSVINFKLKSVKEDGIAIHLDIFVPMLIGIETADIVIILGNLLDNALDAVARVADKFIKVHILYEKGNLLIKVENSFNGNVKTNKETGELETLKTNNDHGYGLKNIRQSARKYDGTVNLSYDNKVFVTEVLLYGKQVSQKNFKNELTTHS